MTQSHGDVLTDIPVLIVGAGPVGLSAAILLARLGIRSLVIERHPSTTDHPKARGFFTRTMEILRPWDVEAQIRANALPSGAFRFIWVETLAGREIGRVEAPRRDVPGPHSPTYVCMAAQDAFEAVLRDHALTYPQIDLRFSTELTTFVQDASRVVTTLRNRDTGETLAARSAWLIAADGASSRTRETLGIRMLGPGEIDHNINIHFRAELAPWVRHRPAAGYISARGNGTLLWAHGTDRWLIVRPFHPAHGENPESFTLERCLEIARRAVGIDDLKVELINLAFWTRTAEVAETFRKGRVFLAGDAAHRFPPTGGFGANSGIQDVHNLAWKLAGVLQGWAGESILVSRRDGTMSERSGVLVAIVANSFGAGAAVATRYLADAADPITLAAIRFGGGVLCLLPLVLMLPVRWPPRQDWPAVAGLGFMFFGVFFIFYNMAFGFTTVARGALALSTLPLITMVIAALLGVEALSTRKTAGVLVAMLGVTVALASGLRDAPVDAWRGDLIMGAAVACAALYNVFSRSYINRSSPLGFVTAGMAVGGGILVGFAVLSGGIAQIARFHVGQTWAALYLAAGGGALNFYLWVLALQRASPTRVTNTMAVVPLVGGLLAAILLAEPITFNLAIGLVAVVAGIWLATMEGQSLRPRHRLRGGEAHWLPAVLRAYERLIIASPPMSRKGQDLPGWQQPAHGRCTLES